MSKKESKIMLSCRKATELVEKQNNSELTTSEKLKLKFHIGMCKSCKTFQRQSILLDKVLHKIEFESIRKSELSQDKKEEIIKEIRK